MVPARVLVVVAALWAGAHAATFTAPCGNIAKSGAVLIDGCVECMNSNQSCQLCHHTRVPKWSTTGAITQVRGASRRPLNGCET